MNKAINIFKENRKDIFGSWLLLQQSQHSSSPITLRSNDEFNQDCDEFFNLFIDNLSDENITSMDHRTFLPVREVLSAISISRTRRGYTARETGVYINSLKQVLLKSLKNTLENPSELYEQSSKISDLIDGFSMLTYESFIKGREDIIVRQKSEIDIISIPLLKVWDGILAVPIVGTLDSERAEAVMEALLKKVAKTDYPIVILDVSGVPMVDSMVADHLIKTVTAIRVMGGQCIISGIRPEIAQSIVHLGIDLSGIITKSTLAAGLKTALRFLNMKVVSNKQ
jgi:rsbT co-antagonist protein RsbR